MIAKKAGDKIKTSTDINNEVERVPMTKESRDRMTLNIYDLQYLVRLQDLSNDAFLEELKEYFLPINTKLESLELGQTRIAADITAIKEDVINIKDRLTISEKRIEDEDSRLHTVEARLERKKERLDVLERQIKLLQPEPIENLIGEIKSLRPEVQKLVKTQRPINIALRIGIAVLLSSIILIMGLQLHKKHFHQVLKSKTEITK